MVRVKLVVALWPPAVPVTVRVAVVGERGVDCWLLAVLPPPPQAIIPETRKTANPERTIRRNLFFVPQKRPANTAANVNGSVHMRGGVRRACVVVATLTVTGTETVPGEKFAETGFGLQVTPVGAPAHDSDTFPVKPLLFVLSTRL